MICAIHKSSKKPGMYLYTEHKDKLEQVPEELREIFGKPEFLMLFNLAGKKQLIHKPNAYVMEVIQNKGFYLQLPIEEQNLLDLLNPSN